MVLKQHLVVDARDCIGDLNSKEKLYKDIIDMVNNVDMELLMTRPYHPKKKLFQINPYVVGASKDEPPGVSGTGIITTSNIAAHLWSDENLANWDVFSCKPFKKSDVRSKIKEFYETNKIKIQTIKRW